MARSSVSEPVLQGFAARSNTPLQLTSGAAILGESKCWNAPLAAERQDVRQH